SGRMIGARGQTPAFGEKDRPQNIGQWRQEPVSEGAAPIARTVARTPAPALGQSASPAMTTQTRAATARTEVADRAKASAELPSPPYASEPATRGVSRHPWTRALVVAAAIALIAAAVYALVASRSDDTQSKIAA